MQKVSVVRCSSYDEDEVYEAVKRSIGLIGGLGIKPNSKVLVKPNILGNRKPEQAITTHPAVVGAICRILKELNCSITIGDSSGAGSYGATKQALKTSGMESVAANYGASLLSFEGYPTVSINDNNAISLKDFSVTKAVKEADYIINVPKLKTHVFMKYTGAVKNMFGCIPGGAKSKCHAHAPREELFGNLLLDICQNIKPHINIMDAIVGLEGNGPGSAGTPKETGLVISSKDAVALDIAASEIIGYNPMDIATIKFAIERGIFPSLYSVELVGEKGVKVDYKKPIKVMSLVPSFLSNFFFKMTSTRPYTNNESCKKCRICEKACPAKAITLAPYPKFNRKTCILCYCCHENCPYNAIRLSRSKTGDLLQYIFNKIRGMLKREDS